MRHPAKLSNILDNSKTIQTKFLLGCDPSYELKNVDDILGQKFEVLFTLINARVQQILRITQHQFFFTRLSRLRCFNDAHMDELLLY